MRFVQQNKYKPSILEIAWMWLPTFIGQNQQLLGEMDHALNSKFPPPLEVDDDKLDEIHLFVIDYLCSKLKIPGLRYYLVAVGVVDNVIPELGKKMVESLLEWFRSGMDWGALEDGEEVPLGCTGMLIKKVDEVEAIEDLADRRFKEATKHFVGEGPEFVDLEMDGGVMHRGEKIVDKRMGISVVNIRPGKKGEQ